MDHTLGGIYSDARIIPSRVGVPTSEGASGPTSCNGGVMGEWIGINRRARKCYGFDEVALVPGMTTINPAEVDPSW